MGIFEHIQQNLKLYLLSTAGIAATAGITWIVETSLSRQTPTVLVESLEMFYDFPTLQSEEFEQTLVNVDDRLLALAKDSYVDNNVRPITYLRDIAQLFDERSIKKRDVVNKQISQSLGKYVEILSVSNPDQDTVARYFTRIYDTTYVFEFLNWGRENGKLSLVNSETSDVIIRHTTPGIGIRLNSNVYAADRLLNSTRPEHKLVVPMLRDVAALIIQKDFNKLKEFFESGIELHRRSVLAGDEITRQVVAVNQPIASKFKKIRMKLQIANTGDVAISISTSCSISLSDPYREKIRDLRCRLKLLPPPSPLQISVSGPTDSTSTESDIYRALIVPPKSVVQTSLVSEDTLGKSDGEVSDLRRAGTLESRVVIVNNSATFPWQKTVQSDWVHLRESFPQSAGDQ